MEGIRSLVRLMSQSFKCAVLRSAVILSIRSTLASQVAITSYCMIICLRVSLDFIYIYIYIYILYIYTHHQKNVPRILCTYLNSSKRFNAPGGSTRVRGVTVDIHKPPSLARFIKNSLAEKKIEPTLRCTCSILTAIHSFIHSFIHAPFLYRRPIYHTHTAAAASRDGSKQSQRGHVTAPHAPLIANMADCRGGAGGGGGGGGGLEEFLEEYGNVKRISG